MNKKNLKKKINDLAKHLVSDKAKIAIETLLHEVAEIVENEQDQVFGESIGFDLPREVVGKSNAYALFTDGACRGNPGPGSYAFMIQAPDGKIFEEDSGVSQHTTNNKMELSAVIEGLKVLSNQVSPMHEIYVYTDSKYVADGMKSWIHSWKKRGWKKADNKTPENIELWQKLDELSHVCHVQFLWVKAHAGHPQNEYVDKMANIVLDENGF